MAFGQEIRQLNESQQAIVGAFREYEILDGMSGEELKVLTSSEFSPLLIFRPSIITNPSLIRAIMKFLSKNDIAPVSHA